MFATSDSVTVSLSDTDWSDMFWLLYDIWRYSWCSPHQLWRKYSKPYAKPCPPVLAKRLFPSVGLPVSSAPKPSPEIPACAQTNSCKHLKYVAFVISTKWEVCMHTEDFVRLRRAIGVTASQIAAASSCKSFQGSLNPCGTFVFCYRSLFLL